MNKKNEANAVEELYREELMDHYQNPRNYGELPGAEVKYHDYNPVCGDDVTMQAKLDNGKIKEARFTGRGCAISQAAASMLTENAEGKNPKQLLQMKNEEMLELLKINPGPVRIKCALLALRALQKGLIEYEARKL